MLARRLSQEKAAQLLGLTSRHVRRMCRAYERKGARGLISRKRGKPSYNQSLAAVRDQEATGFGADEEQETIAITGRSRVGGDTAAAAHSGSG